jgi:hypothetical protein
LIADAHVKVMLVLTAVAYKKRGWHGSIFVLVQLVGCSCWCTMAAGTSTSGICDAQSKLYALVCFCCNWHAPSMSCCCDHQLCSSMLSFLQLPHMPACHNCLTCMPVTTASHACLLQPPHMHACYNRLTCMPVTTASHACMLQPPHMHACYNRLTCMPVTTASHACMLQPPHMHACYNRLTCMHATTASHACMLQPPHMHASYNRLTCMHAVTECTCMLSG